MKIFFMLAFTGNLHYTISIGFLAISSNFDGCKYFFRGCYILAQSTAFEGVPVTMPARCNFAFFFARAAQADAL